MSRKSVRRGFGALELLVVIAIIAILIALLLPALGKVGEAARRNQCVNNFKMVGLALANYENVYTCFPAAHYSPPGDQRNRHHSGLGMLTPFLEETDIYGAINFSLGVDHKANSTVKSKNVSTYVCPSDLIAEKGKTSSTNYFLSAGRGPSTLSKDNNKTDCVRGLFWQCSRTKVNQIVDGLSRTIATVESVTGAPTPKTLARQYVYMDVDLPANVDPNVGAADWAAGNNLKLDRGSCWLDGRLMQATLFAELEPNSASADVAYRDFAGGVSGPRSLHPGGVNVGMVDGSVNFISQSIDRKVFDAMATIDGNENL